MAIFSRGTPAAAPLTVITPSVSLIRVLPPPLASMQQPYPATHNNLGRGAAAADRNAAGGHFDSARFLHLFTQAVLRAATQVDRPAAGVGRSRPGPPPPRRWWCRWRWSKDVDVAAGRRGRGRQFEPPAGLPPLAKLSNSGIVEGTAPRHVNAIRVIAGCPDSGTVNAIVKAAVDHPGSGVGAAAAGIQARRRAVGAQPAGAGDFYRYLSRSPRRWREWHRHWRRTFSVLPAQCSTCALAPLTNHHPVANRLRHVIVRVIRADGVVDILVGFTEGFVKFGQVGAC